MKYPQLDIRTYDPHLSTSLADMVCGTFFFDGMPHDVRVLRLKALIDLQAFVENLGDFEHTGDWDWRVSVCAGPPGETGKTFGTTDESWATNLELGYEVEPEDYTSRFSRWQDLTVIQWDYDADEETINLVPVDQIRFVTIWYDT